MQEFNREANTLGSKATKESITRNAVQLKVLIEQMREQVQNIEWVLRLETRRTIISNVGYCFYGFAIKNRIFKADTLLCVVVI